MVKEVWRDIIHYEGKYQVSNYGDVKSFCISPMYGENNNGIMLKTELCRGYLHVTLCVNGKRKNFPVHKLVAIAFLNNIPDGTNNVVVNHIDGDKLNNTLSNLELVSNRYNVSDGYNRKKNSSNYTGVSWDNRCKKWRSQIQINKKKILLGLFDTEMEASILYQMKLMNK